MKKNRLSVLLLVVVMLLQSCAGFMVTEATTPAEVVASYGAIGFKLQKTDANVRSTCLTEAVLSKSQCRDVQITYNFARDIYGIAGEYVNLILDPENSGKYRDEAVNKVVTLVGVTHYSEDIGVLVTAIDNIVNSADPNLSDLDRAELILTIINDNLLLSIAKFIDK